MEICRGSCPAAALPPLSSCRAWIVGAGTSRWPDAGTPRWRQHHRFGGDGRGLHVGAASPSRVPSVALTSAGTRPIRVLGRQASTHPRRVQDAPAGHQPSRGAPTERRWQHLEPHVEQLAAPAPRPSPASGRDRPGVGLGTQACCSAAAVDLRAKLDGAVRRAHTASNAALQPRRTPTIATTLRCRAATMSCLTTLRTAGCRQ